MASFERPNNSGDYNLSQGELASTRDELARWLISHGEVIPNYGTDAAEPSQEVYEFSHQIDDVDFVRDMFFPEGGVIAREMTISCTTPYDIEPGAVDGKFSFGVNVIASGVVDNEMINTVDQLDVMIHLGIRQAMQDGHFEGVYGAEFARGAIRVSPNDVQIDDPYNMTVANMHDLSKDLGALEREMSSEDMKILHRIIDYLEEA
jgi:hypothetical protein